MDRHYIIDRRAYADRRLNETKKRATRLDAKACDRRDDDDRRESIELPNTIVFENEDTLHQYIQALPELENKDFRASIDDHGLIYKIVEKTI